MGCGTIKTNESKGILEGNISQSDLLPIVKVNKRSNIDKEEQKSISKINITNKKSIEQKESINSNSSELSNSNDKLTNKKDILQIEENKKNSFNNNKKSKDSSTSKNQKTEKTKQNQKKMYEMLSSVNMNSNYEEVSESNNNKDDKVSDSINNKYENEEINANLNREEEGSENMLKKKAYTTGKIPRKTDQNISSIEDKVPKIIEKSQFANGLMETKFLEIELKANIYETIFPIWIQEEEEIEFIISGKWKINNEIECDCNGIKNNNNSNQFNDGALIGRILKGQPFLIYNGLKYISDISGPLILKMNLNSLWKKEKPLGSLKLKIYGAHKVENADDLEEKIGWWKQLRIIGFNNKDELNDYQLSNTEKSIIILFNKLRHDSKLFTNQYLENYQRLTPTTKRIFEQFTSNKEQFIPFKINLSIIKLLQNFYIKFINKKNKIKEEDWIYILRSEDYLKKYLEESFNNKKKLFVSIIRYYEDNPFYLGLRILFRDNIRNNMLSYNFEEISIITLFNNLRKDGKKIYYCIVVLSNQNGNDKVYYDLNKNIEQFIEDEKKLEVHLSTSRQFKKL